MRSRLPEGLAGERPVRRLAVSDRQDVYATNRVERAGPWVAVAMLAAGATVWAQPLRIADLGKLPNGTWSRAYGVSGDGLVVVGSADQWGSEYAFRWTSSEGMVKLGTLWGDTDSRALGVNADGSLVVGASFQGTSTRAFRWTPAEGMSNLGGSRAWGVSADGQVVVGESGSRAVRWTAAAGMQELYRMPQQSYAGARAASADGSVIVGYSNYKIIQVIWQTRGIRWSGPTYFGWDIWDLPGEGYSEVRAFGVDYQGSTVVGRAGSSSGDRAFRWDELAYMKSLGVLPGGSWSQANAVNADGAVVVGLSDSSNGECAFLWTQSLGMVDLNAYLTSLGVDLTNWHLREATAISANGKTIVGIGTYKGAERGWVVYPPKALQVPLETGEAGVCPPYVPVGRDAASSLE